MATDRDRPDSWKSNSNARRDFRHTKGDPEVIDRGKRKSGKWCGRKVGREHLPLVRDDSESWWVKYICPRCHKVVKMNFVWPR